MVHRSIVQTDLWSTYADILLVIDSFQDALIFPGHHILILTDLTTFSGPPFIRIYNNNPKTQANLKDNIKREIRKIPVDVIERVIDNFNARIGTVIRRQGAWIEHTVLSTIIRNRKVSCFHVLSQLEDKISIMLVLIGEKIFMICCLSKEIDEKQSKALFLDHHVYVTVYFKFYKIRIG